MTRTNQDQYAVSGYYAGARRTFRIFSSLACLNTSPSRRLSKQILSAMGFRSSLLFLAEHYLSYPFQDEVTPGQVIRKHM
jgi:hypothetical protein